MESEGKNRYFVLNENFPLLQEYKISMKKI